MARVQHRKLVKAMFDILLYQVIKLPCPRINEIVTIITGFLGCWIYRLQTVLVSEAYLVNELISFVYRPEVVNLWESRPPWGGLEFPVRNFKAQVAAVNL